MATPAQIEANRRNALKSTGPRTARGKAVSARNALRHGVHSTLLLPEETDKICRIEADFSSEWRPQSPLENRLVRHLAESAYHMHRANWLEFRCYDRLTAALGSGSAAGPAGYERGVNDLLQIARYRGRAERTFIRALHQLRILRPREKCRNEPNGAEPGRNLTGKQVEGIDFVAGLDGNVL